MPFRPHAFHPQPRYNIGHHVVVLPLRQRLQPSRGTSPTSGTLRLITTSRVPQTFRGPSFFRPLPQSGGPKARKAELVGPVQLHAVTHIHEAVDELGGFIVVLPFLVGGRDSSGFAEKNSGSPSADVREAGSASPTDGRTSGGSDDRTSGASSGSAGDSAVLSIAPAARSMSVGVGVAALQLLVILLKTSKPALEVWRCTRGERSLSSPTASPGLTIILFPRPPPPPPPPPPPLLRVLRKLDRAHPLFSTFCLRPTLFLVRSWWTCCLIWCVGGAVDVLGSTAMPSTLAVEEAGARAGVWEGLAPRPRPRPRRWRGVGLGSASTLRSACWRTCCFITVPIGGQGEMKKRRRKARVLRPTLLLSSEPSRTARVGRPPSTVGALLTATARGERRWPTWYEFWSSALTASPRTSRRFAVWAGSR